MKVLIFIMAMMFTTNVLAMNVNVKSKVHATLDGHVSGNEIQEQSECLSSIFYKISTQPNGVNGLIRSDIISGLLINNKPCVVFKLIVNNK